MSVQGVVPQQPVLLTNAGGESGWKDPSGGADFLKIVVLTPRLGMETKRILFRVLIRLSRLRSQYFCEYAPIYLGNWQ
jgi:hypothetical protein